MRISVRRERRDCGLAAIVSTASQEHDKDKEPVSRGETGSRIFQSKVSWKSPMRRRPDQAFLPSGAAGSAGGSGAFSGAGAVLQGAAQAELQAPQAVGQQAAAALQQLEPGQQPLPQPLEAQALPQQLLPQPAPQAPQGAAQLPQPAPQPPQGAAQLLQPPQGAAQLGAGQQALAPQQPRRRERQRASASLDSETTNSAARADNANSFRIMMWDS
jgi:hypothetical protein